MVEPFTWMSPPAMAPAAAPSTNGVTIEATPKIGDHCRCHHDRRSPWPLTATAEPRKPTPGDAKEYVGDHGGEELPPHRTARHGVGRPQDAVDDPRLTPDLRDHPAALDRQERGRPPDRRGAQEPTRFRQCLLADPRDAEPD